MITQAVILAAGMGQRLRGRWSDQPKGLLPFAGLSLVERSIDRLQAAGITHIHVVTGHLAEHYQALAARVPGMTCLHNPDYAHTGSFMSLCTAGRVVTGPFLLLESDLLYEPAALSALLEDPWPDLILVGRSPLHDKVFVTADGQHSLLAMSKSEAAADQAVGELVGISKLSAGLVTQLVDFVSAETRRWDYEQALVCAARTRDVRVAMRPGLAWCEIDDAEHYDLALQKVWPVIQQRERHVAQT